MTYSSTIYDIIRANSDKRPEKTALILGEKRLNYGMILSLTEGLTRMLLDSGVSKGTHLALSAPNSLEFALLMLSAAKLGAVIVPLPPGMKGAGCASAVRTAECSRLIAPATVCDAFCAAQLFCNEDCINLENVAKFCDGRNQEKKFTLSYTVDPSCDYILTMTSGSTGHPKPIVFTQETKLVRAYDATRDIYGLDDESVILTSTPMHHSLAQRSVLLPLLLGGTGVILPKFTPSAWINAVKSENVTFLFAVSNQLEILLDYIGTSPDFPSLKTVVSSSAQLKDGVKERLLSVFSCTIDECYGTSEIGVATNISMNSHRDKLGSVGLPLPHVDVKITDSARIPLQEGEVGEIACKTLTRFSRYYKNPDATDRCFDNEGYFYTGDLGFLDNEGYLYYRGRSRDVIITGGINVYPQDIEEVLVALPEVEECAVIGVEDSYFGEAVLAVLVSKNSCVLDIGKVMRHCAGNLAEYQQPMAYEIMPALPRNQMGKLLKEDLRNIYRGYDATRKLRSLLIGGKDGKIK